MLWEKKPHVWPLCLWTKCNTSLRKEESSWKYFLSFQVRKQTHNGVHLFILNFEMCRKQAALTSWGFPADKSPWGHCLVNELMKNLGPCIDPLLRSFLWNWNMPLIYELTLTWQMRNRRGRKEPVLQRSRVHQSSLNFWKCFTWTFTSLADRNIVKRIIFLLLQNLNKAGLIFVMLHFTPRQWRFIEGFPHPLLWLETTLNWATEVFEFCVNISV